MLATADPKTIEDALILFPHVTASARYFSKTWQYSVESHVLFISDETPVATHMAGRISGRMEDAPAHRISDWEKTLARRRQ